MQTRGDTRGSAACTLGGDVYRPGPLTSAGVVVLGLYLGLGPIYWLPGISPIHLDRLKTVLFIGAVAVTWLAVISRLGGQIRLPNGIVGPRGFVVAVAAATPGLAQSGPEEALQALVSIASVFTMLWTVYALERAFGLGRIAVGLGAIVVLCAAGLATASWLFDVPAWTSPSEYRVAPLWAFGFGTGRTGWSNALAIYIGPAVALTAASRVGPLSRGLAGGLVVAVFLMAQVASGGRAGVLGSAVVLLGLAASAWPRAAILGVGLAVIGAFLVLPWDLVTGYLRLGEVQLSTFEGLDRVSTSRLSSYVSGWGSLIERPILGYGFEAVSFVERIGVVEPHNNWLRLAVASGVILPTAIFSTIVVAGMRILRWARPQNERAAAVLRWSRDPLAAVLPWVIVAGVALSLLEPAVLVGAFQNCAMWWALMGYGLARAAACRGQRGQHSVIPGHEMPNQHAPA